MTLRSPISSYAASRARPLGPAFAPPSGARPFGGVGIGVTRKLTTGTPPDLASMHRLAWDGCETLLDLRSEKTPFAAFNAVETMRDAREAGLHVVRRPIDRAEPDAAAIAILVRDFRRLNGAFYAFCEDGRLALMLALMADTRILTSGQLQARMAAWGAPLLDGPLRAFLDEWYAGSIPAPPKSIVGID